MCDFEWRIARLPMLKGGLAVGATAPRAAALNVTAWTAAVEDVAGTFDLLGEVEVGLQPGYGELVLGAERQYLNQFQQPRRAAAALQLTAQKAKDSIPPD